MTENFKDLSALDFKLILHAVPDLYLILNPQFEIVEVSDAYLKITMLKRKDVLGRFIFDVFPDNLADQQATGVDKLRASLTRVMTLKTRDVMAIQKYDIRRPQSEGSAFEERYWNPINCPVFGENGEIKYIIHRLQDITEYVILKQFETASSKLLEEMQARAGHMEIEISQRTEDIQKTSLQLQNTYEKLAKKTKEQEYLFGKLEQLNRLKAQFFANVSQELRTPLTLIIGPLGKLLVNPSLLPYQHDLKVIERNAHVLLKLVNDLLDVAKLDSGKMKINYATHDLAFLLKQTVALFESYAHEHHIHFDTRIPEKLIAEIDADKIQRAIMNLLTNAFKFTPSKGLIRLELMSDASQAKIIVADSGPGISSKIKEEICSLTPSLKEYSDPRSTGFGLEFTIVKDFIELHHGSASIVDAKEGGVAFIITLPLKAPSGISVTSQESSIVSQDVALQIVSELKSSEKNAREQKKLEPLHRPLILVVEDNDDMNQFKQSKDELKQKDAQLVQQEKIAALWHLTTIIAHEIKNPLNYVINCAELSLGFLSEINLFLQKYNQDAPEEAKESVMENLDNIRTNLSLVLKHGHIADHIIRKMTEHALAKAETRSPTNFNEFLQEALLACEQRLHEKFGNFKVLINKVLDPTLPFLAIDTVAILKVIYNLLNNSYYSLWQKKQLLGEAFNPIITITVKNLNNHCEIHLQDNGMGIPTHLKSKIFSPFFTTKPKGEGVGLGLSLSYNTIVQEHSGTIRFESEEGKGTEFIIVLPI